MALPTIKLIEIIPLLCKLNFPLGDNMWTKHEVPSLNGHRHQKRAGHWIRHNLVLRRAKLCSVDV
jgi:hypothetical protein